MPPTRTVEISRKTRHGQARALFSSNPQQPSGRSRPRKPAQPIHLHNSSQLQQNEFPGVAVSLQPTGRFRFLCSDGNGTLPPTNKINNNPPADLTKQAVDFFTQPKTSDRITQHWHHALGRFIANDILKLKGPDKVWSIDALPEGYNLYQHIRHLKRDNKKGAIPRTDNYLFGRADGAVYRSVAEFLPHATWLLQNMEGQPCECKYCDTTKKRKR